MKHLRTLIVLITATVFSGCATILKDDSQPVSFNSDPPGALITINGNPKGKTSTTIVIQRKAEQSVVDCTLEGYHPLNFALKKSVADATFGNILLGRVLGVAVDIATGKATNYQDHVTVKRFL